MSLPDHVIVTRQRFEQLIAIERSAGDIHQMMIDFAGTRLKPGERLLEMSMHPYSRAILIAAFTDLGEALSPPEPIDA